MPLERLKLFGGADAVGRDTSKIISQQLTGMGMLSGALSLRGAMGDDTKWHQRKDSKGEYKDMKALFGPFAIWMLLADVMTRASNVAERAGGAPLVKGKVVKRFDMEAFNETVGDPAIWDQVLTEISVSKIGREALKAGLGTTFKSGVNLNVAEKAITEWVETKGTAGAAKPIADLFASYFGSFLTPIGFYKDVRDALVYDEDARFYKDTDLVSPWPRLVAKTSRSLRPIPTADERIFDPTGGQRGRPEDATSGLLKQATGATKIQMPTPVAKALNEINLEPYEVFRRKYADPELNRVHMSYYSLWSETIGIPYVLSDAYRKSDDGKTPRKVSSKRFNLKKKVTEGISGPDGETVTFEDYYLKWAGENLSGARLEEAQNKILKLKYDRYPQDLIDAARGAFKTDADRQGLAQNSLDNLPLDERIAAIEQFKKKN